MIDRYDALRATTAPALLVRRAREDAGVVALRSKHRGLYRERTWRDLAILVARAAVGLATLGLARGERLAIIGDVCEEWAVLDLAAQSLGAITFGIYPTASSAEAEYQMNDAGAAIAICEDQEYVDKILPLADRLPALRAIVVIDDTAMIGYDDRRLVPLAKLLGAAPGDDALLAALEAHARRIDPQDAAFIVYTSGTTGHPKGALVSHGKHLAGTYNIVEHYPTLAAKTHRTVVYLPMCHVLGRDIAITLPLLSKLVPHYGEDPENLIGTLFEVAPTVLFAVPRYLQKIASQVLVGIASTSTIKRKVYEQALVIGRRHAKLLWDNGGDGATRPLAEALYRMWHAVAFRPILNKLGLDQLELVICGGAPLPPETMALWQIWGVNVIEMYGQTETGGAIISGQQGPFPRPGNVGTPPTGWEIKLSADNEVLVKGRDLFEGYWNRPDATAEVLDADGWLHTGDVGELREGNLRLVDRARDFIVTAGGKTLSPSYIENIVRASPYVGEVVVFGHGRKYVVALIEIDFDTVSEWARTHAVTYTGFTNLAEHAQVQTLMAGEIERANAQLARVESIKRFRILPKALDPEEEGEPVTPTRKVKRKLMYERFAALVESMYDDDEERRVAAEIGAVLLK